MCRFRAKKGKKGAGKTSASASASAETHDHREQGDGSCAHVGESGQKDISHQRPGVAEETGSAGDGTVVAAASLSPSPSPSPSVPRTGPASSRGRGADGHGGVVRAAAIEPKDVSMANNLGDAPLPTGACSSLEQKPREDQRQNGTGQGVDEGASSSSSSAAQAEAEAAAEAAKLAKKQKVRQQLQQLRSHRTAHSAGAQQQEQQEKQEKQERQEQQQQQKEQQHQHQRQEQQHQQEHTPQDQAQPLNLRPPHHGNGHDAHVGKLGDDWDGAMEAAKVMKEWSAARERRMKGVMMVAREMEGMLGAAAYAKGGNAVHDAVRANHMLIQRLEGSGFGFPSVDVAGEAPGGGWSPAVDAVERIKRATMRLHGGLAVNHAAPTSPSPGGKGAADDYDTTLTPNGPTHLLSSSSSAGGFGSLAMTYLDTPTRGALSSSGSHRRSSGLPPSQQHAAEPDHDNVSREIWAAPWGQGRQQGASGDVGPESGPKFGAHVAGAKGGSEGTAPAAATGYDQMSATELRGASGQRVGGGISEGGRGGAGAGAGQDMVPELIFENSSLLRRCRVPQLPNPEP